MGSARGQANHALYLGKVLLAAWRRDLAAESVAAVTLIQAYLPAQLGEDELTAMIDEAIAASGASGMQAMGAVMAELKPKLQGRADMGAVSKQVKARLTA